MTSESIKQTYQEQIARAHFAYREGLYDLCRVLLYTAEQTVKDLEKETLKRK